MPYANKEKRNAYIAEYKRNKRRERGLQKQGRKPATPEERVLIDIEQASLILKRSRDWKKQERLNNPEWHQKEKEKSKQWRLKNPEKSSETIRNSTLKAKYGITTDSYDLMSEQQGHLCLICARKDKNKRLAVDHCHETGKIRGLLCQACNTTLGKVEEREDILLSMIDYLRNHK